MRLLLANPNTSQAITGIVAAAARAVAGAGTEIVPVTARFGARVIGTRAELAVAEHASLDLVAREAAGCEAVVIAASTDSGLRAARELLAVPVLGLTESALHVACLTGGRFAAITLSRRSGHTLRELIDGYGLAGRCCAQRALEATPTQLLERPDEVADMIAAAALAESEADVIVLVGAVMAAMPARIQARLPVPVIEGVSCAVALAEALARLRLPKPMAGGYAAPHGRATTGLGEALATRMQGIAE